MAWKKSSEQLVEKFYENIEFFEEAELRKMFGYPCSFVNGNMCTGLHEENWIVRLSEEDRKELQDNHEAVPFAPMGRVMREYLALPQNILEDQKQLKDWLERSFAFTSALPPKPKKK